MFSNPLADIVIVTLGLIEAWFDALTGSYLNRMHRSTRCEKIRAASACTCCTSTRRIRSSTRPFRMLTDRGMKVLLTVSPVPLTATFSEECVVVANSFSKAILRVCAYRLATSLPGVDYFPSYEIVMSRVKTT